MRERREGGQNIATHSWTKASLSSVPALSTPNGPALSLPNGPVLSLPNGPVLSLPSGPALSLPNGPALSLPNGPALSLPNGPALSPPNGWRPGRQMLAQSSVIQDMILEMTFSAADFLDLSQTDPASLFQDSAPVS